MSNTTPYTPEQVSHTASKCLACPEYLPRRWSEMTPSEQAMTLWFIRGRDYFTKSAVAWHILACAIEAKGDHLTEQEADDLWALVYGAKPE